MKPIRTLCFLAFLLAGCSAPVAPPVPADTGAPVADAQGYLKSAQAGQAVYRIDAAQSLIAITVRRGGSFARFGHDHVIASRTVAGYAAPDEGRADFAFRLDQMTVDEQGLRAEAGLETVPDAEAIAGTRRNMLTRVLDAERYPLVQLQVTRMPGRDDVVRLGVSLHGVTRVVEAPARIERSASQLTASGAFTLLQTEFGITPMSVMGGAMTVQDRMELRYRIVAAPLR